MQWRLRLRASAADAQYDAWVAGHPAMQVQPEFNGLAFIPEYKTWQAISSTDRTDNHTCARFLATMWL